MTFHVPAAPAAPASTSNPVLLVMSISAAVDAVVVVAGFADMVPHTVAFWIVAGNIALKAGLGFWLRGNVVPLVNVAARRTPHGDLVAGPAATGEPDGTHDPRSLAPIPVDAPVSLTRDARTDFR